MAETVPRETRDPIVVALGLALREIAERRAAERLERRATMTVVEGGRRGGNMPLQEPPGFEDQPVVDVWFEIPDYTKPDFPVERRRVSVHRGVTGMVIESTQGINHPERFIRIEAFIDRWEGDTPITRVEINPFSPK